MLSEMDLPKKEHREGLHISGSHEKRGFIKNLWLAVVLYLRMITNLFVFAIHYFSSDKNSKERR